MSGIRDEPIPGESPWSRLWRDTFNQSFADGGTVSLAAECADEAVNRYVKAMEA